jgi:hypothetical protein
MDQEGISYLVLSLIMPILAFSSLPSLGKGIFTLFVLILLLLCICLVLLLNWIDYTIFSFVTSLFGITFQPAINYKIVKGQDAIVKTVRGLYYATGFLSANLFPYYFKQEETGAGTDEGKMLQAPESWERGVMNLDFPFKYHVLSTGLDVQKVRDELEGKRSFQEFQLSRVLQSASANEVSLTDLRRKISILQAQIDRISQGEKPIATLMYFETTAVGVSEKAALDTLSTQLSSLQISMSGLDVDLVRVIGRELYTLFSYNFSLPTAFGDLAMQFDQQS